MGPDSAAKTLLQQKLARIRHVFDITTIVSLVPDTRDIRYYYHINRHAYSLFYPFTDRMYMGVSRDGVYKAEDLLEAARVVENYIRQCDATRILELATGRGATSAYLAKKYPDVHFDGIDISDSQLKYAYKKARHLPNYQPVLGDYHDLSRYATGSADIVFEIEGLCYSRHKQRVLREVKRILTPGGVFILFDGYARSDRENMEGSMRLALKLLEKSMAVPEFEVYTDFIRKAQREGFAVVADEDVSVYILPTLRRFERMAKLFFAFPQLARLVAKFLPPELVYNAIAGYLFSDCISCRIGCYYITVLKRQR